MDSKLEKIEAKRLELYQVYKKENLIGVFGIVFVVLLIFIGYIATTPFIFLLAIIPGIAAGVYFSKAGKHLSQFKTIVQKELVIGLLEEQFEQVYYDANQMIDLSKIYATSMVRKADRHSGEDYIRGIYKDLPFEVSEIDLKRRVETRDSKGNVHVSYQTYFKGRWYIFKFSKPLGGTLKIFEQSGSVNTRNLIKVETESIQFNKKFRTFSSTQEFAFYHITPLILEKMLELESMHRGSILYCFQDSALHIGVNDNKDYLHISIRTPITKEAIANFIGDIDLIPAIINELRLHTSKYNIIENKKGNK